ncbi:MAG: c-type cytochrome [Gammaproteobacteria bacterium]|nr:c-type cytochrome [Gammaproteobacteria bacterium]MCF6230934.1 c-type cytochrome [Gammaproteobacteria bacterium]
MKYGVVLGGLLIIFSAQTIASEATSALNLAKQKGCLGCHHVERTEVGPSWKEVAEKYGEDENATYQLAGSILYGSMGNWGDRPMRGHAKKMDKDEALKLAEFIMSL